MNLKNNIIVLPKACLQSNLLKEELIDLFQEYVTERRNDRTYNRDKTKSYIQLMELHPAYQVFIAFEHNGLNYGDMLGVAFVGYEEDCTEERYGFIYKFYVLKKARGSWVSRLLAGHASWWFDENNCIKSFTTTNGEIGHDQEYINLLGKFGYSPSGKVLERGINTWPQSHLSCRLSPECSD